MSFKAKQTPGNIIFFIGIFSGLALAVLAIWAALEVQAYYYTGETFEAFNGLHCPLLMTRSETGTITVSFDNPSDEEIQPYYKVETSGPIPQQFENQIVVPPHSSKNIEWTVGVNDIDLRSFIFSRVEILPSAGHGSRQAICGIPVLNIPGATGEQVFIFTLLLSLSAIAIGFTWWSRSVDKNTSANMIHSMQALGVSVLAAMLFAFIGWTLVGLIFSIIAILLLFIILRFAVG